MSVIFLTKRFHFESAHRMWNAAFSVEQNHADFGKCQNIHGHNYILELTVSGEIDPAKGYFINLHTLAKEVQENIIDVIDHKYLNDILPGKKHLPVTIEVIAQWIWDTLHEDLPIYNYSKLRLWETPDNSTEISK